MDGIKNTGGVARVVYYLNDILTKSGYNVSIQKRNTKKRFYDKVFYPILFSFKLLFKKKFFIISNSYQSFLYPVDICIHHGTTFGFALNSNQITRGTKILTWMEKKSCKTAKKIIAVSNNNKDELINYYHANSDKISIIHNFVDENIFFPIKNEPKNKTIILFSGEMQNNKGLQVFIELANEIEKTDNFILRIASINNKNMHFFECLNNTEILTDLDINGMRNFYNSGDVFFFPTKYEGFSMSTLEALSCGIPVVGTKFAIQDNLVNYDFTYIDESNDILQTLDIIQKMKDKFFNKKMEIHNIIKKDFGYEQYKSKILNLIENQP